VQITVSPLFRLLFATNLVHGLLCALFHPLLLVRLVSEIIFDFVSALSKCEHSARRCASSNRLSFEIKVRQKSSRKSSTLHSNALPTKANWRIVQSHPFSDIEKYSELPCSSYSDFTPSPSSASPSSSRPISLACRHFCNYSPFSCPFFCARRPVCHSHSPVDHLHSNSL
jgi:hypothetical protein